MVIWPVVFCKRLPEDTGTRGYIGWFWLGIFMGVQPTPQFGDAPGLFLIFGADWALNKP